MQKSNSYAYYNAIAGYQIMQQDRSDGDLLITVKISTEILVFAR